MNNTNEATRLVCLEAAQKLRTYAGIYTGDKQARRLVDELSNIADSLATSAAPERSGAEVGMEQRIATLLCAESGLTAHRANQLALKITGLIPADSSSAAPSDEISNEQRVASLLCSVPALSAHRANALAFDIDAIYRAAPAPTGESLSFDDLYKTGVKPWSQRIPKNSDFDVIAAGMQDELNDLRPIAAAALATPRQTEDGGLSAAGWVIGKRPDGRISASHEKHGFFTVEEEDDSVRASVAWLLLNDMLAAPKKPAAQGGVPEGWKLAPEEPTEEMLDSCRAWYLPGITLPMFVAAYKAMLAAAPTGASK